MSPERVCAFVALGSNLESPAQQVRLAISALDQLPSTRVVQASSLYQTPPWGVLDQPDFVNAVAELETALTPHDLLSELQRLEEAAGRVRARRFGPRVLDLDLLWHGQGAIETPLLTLPHPRMHERAFVMLPLAEIAPGLGLATGTTAAQQAARLDAAGILRLPPSQPVRFG